jgi:hypothetical protein
MCDVGSNPTPSERVSEQDSDKLCNGSSVLIYSEIFPYELRDYYLHKKEHAPWNYVRCKEIDFNDF